jgi:hypothetical protein
MIKSEKETSEEFQLRVFIVDEWDKKTCGNPYNQNNTLKRAQILCMNIEKILMVFLGKVLIPDLCVNVLEFLFDFSKIKNMFFEMHSIWCAKDVSKIYIQYLHYNKDFPFLGIRAAMINPEMLTFSPEEKELRSTIVLSDFERSQELLEQHPWLTHSIKKLKKNLEYYGVYNNIDEIDSIVYGHHHPDTVLTPPKNINNVPFHAHVALRSLKIEGRTFVLTSHMAKCLMGFSPKYLMYIPPSMIHIIDLFGEHLSYVNCEALHVSHCVSAFIDPRWLTIWFQKYKKQTNA